MCLVRKFRRLRALNTEYKVQQQQQQQQLRTALTPLRQTQRDTGTVRT